MYYWSTKEQYIPIIPGENSRMNEIEMKLVPNNIEQCLLQFDVLKIFLGVSLHEGYLPKSTLVFIKINRAVFLSFFF